MKKSLLVIHKIRRLFVNTLTVDEKHYLLNRDILTQPIQMQLSQKQKAFPRFFFFFLHFLNLYSILNICQQKITFIADVFPEIPAPKNMVRKMSKKPCFRGPLETQQGKCVETLWQSE